MYSIHVWYNQHDAISNQVKYKAMVTQGIIVAAGYGSRFFPITKQVPKEMLPVGTRPAIDYIIEEFIKSGITKIYIVISKHKQIIKQYYRPTRWLERALRLQNKPEQLAIINPPRISITFAYQNTMRGSGHALLQCAKYIKEQPVIVAYPDDIHHGAQPLSAQLIEKWKQHGKSVLSSLYNPPHIERYGVLSVKDSAVLDIVEKPPLDALPSKYALIGRFLLTPAFFTYLREGWRHVRSNTKQEYYHIYALKKIMAHEGVLHSPIVGTRLDIGEPTGYYQAIQHLAKVD